jgi:hypothetical protein
MSAFTATADTPLRQAWPPGLRDQAGGLAPRDLNVLFQVRLGLSGLRTPVSHGVSAVSSRTVMNNVGKASPAAIRADKGRISATDGVRHEY